MKISKSREKSNTSLDDGEIQARIESALYAAGRPLSPKEMTSAARITSKRRIIRVARNLARIVNSTLNAIEIVELEDRRFAMQLRQKYNPIAKRFSMKPLIPPSILKTLSYVAYFQPISRSNLVERRGKHAYSHLKTLEKLGFISGKPSGRTKVYRTTLAFSEYFGLSSDVEVMKKQLFKIGLQRKERASKGQRSIIEKQRNLRFK
ncbi:MAG: SMC-Scp complex subunit ScpB [Candidatus Methylarchaceae archaeon HK01B]|nr:SMC-Scp complex subunit ScpB [Candidatus Methylarchaceae archaeon HK01M]MCP8311414.1 SMC-Scp complex subunit ScpB [Candidatus Methylarchaceae archaeon HK02M1]MCP8318332.1 SMC-Scp complex subunit ScpB [Candidatus Methylarchaceae archaeon HK01B]